MRQTATCRAGNEIPRTSARATKSAAYAQQETEVGFKRDASAQSRALVQERSQSMFKPLVDVGLECVGGGVDIAL